MNELALFAGIGGGILGGKLLGWRTICAVEINAYCASVLVQRQNEGILDPFPIWDDVTTFDGKSWRGIVDLVSGGFPCQDISVANPNGKGLDGERSGLWSEFARIIGEVRPRYVFVENSPNLTVLGGVRVIGDLTKLGYDCRWGVMGARHIGADHHRDRIWICANANCIRLQRRIVQRKEVRKKGTEEQFARLVRFLLQRAIPSGSRGRKTYVSSHQVERLKAIGNAQVPAVAALAWRTLSQ